MLINHCNNSEQNLQEMHNAMTAILMKMKLQLYEKKLMQEPVIITTYLKPQISKPTDPAEVLIIIEIVRNFLQWRYFAEISSTKSKDLPSGASCNSLFAAMLQPHGVDSEMNDKVDQYFLIDVVHASGFIYVLSWWSSRKDALPSH